MRAAAATPSADAPSSIVADRAHRPGAVAERVDEPAQRVVARRDPREHGRYARRRVWLQPLTRAADTHPRAPDAPPARPPGAPPNGARLHHPPSAPPLVFLVIGLLIVIGSVIGGYVMHHGKVGVLWQPTEFIIIGGAGLGAFIMANGIGTLKASLAATMGLLKPNPFSKTAYGELLQVLYEVFQKARKDGLVGLEAHIEDPSKSDIFAKYPAFSRTRPPSPCSPTRSRCCSPAPSRTTTSPRSSTSTSTSSSSRTCTCRTRSPPWATRCPASASSPRCSA
jgi:hypothetical protein